MFERFRAVRGAVGHAPTRYELVLSDGVDGATLRSVLATAGSSGWREAALELGQRTVILTAWEMKDLVGKLAPESSALLVLVIRDHEVEVWRAPVPLVLAEYEGPPEANEPDAPKPKSVGTVATSKLRANLEKLLARECKASSSCESVLVFIDPTANSRALRDTLKTLADTARPSSAEPFRVHVQLGEPHERGKPLAFVPRKVDDSAVSARLPPEIIQSVVRANFSAFRQCYERGLAKNAQLRGKVVARFVIGRDGAVWTVEDGGSDLADREVVSCVLDGFLRLKFPAPVGGILTVVYPIMLAPG